MTKSYLLRMRSIAPDRRLNMKRVAHNAASQIAPTFEEIGTPVNAIEQAAGLPTLVISSADAERLGRKARRAARLARRFNR